jgi:hypothetical protein
MSRNKKFIPPQTMSTVKPLETDEMSNTTETPISIEPIEAIVEVAVESIPQYFLDDKTNDARLHGALTTLTNYTEDDHNVNEVAYAQQQFYTHLQRTLYRGSVEEISFFMTAILDFISKNNNPGEHFTVSRCYTGFNELKLSVNQNREFQMLVRVLMDTANPDTRKAKVKSFAWDNVKRSFVVENSEQFLNVLKEFYEV